MKKILFLLSILLCSIGVNAQSSSTTVKKKPKKVTGLNVASTVPDGASVVIAMPNDTVLQTITAANLVNTRINNALLNHYTTSQIDNSLFAIQTALNSKASETHGHTWDQVTGKPTALSQFTNDLTYPVTSVNGLTGNVSITKATLGLSAISNTSDANKPVSTLQAAALALKSDVSHTHPAQTISISGSVLNLSGGGGSVTLPAASSLPSQTGNTDKFLATDGVTPFWSYPYLTVQQLTTHAEASSLETGSFYSVPDGNGNKQVFIK